MIRSAGAMVAGGLLLLGVGPAAAAAPRHPAKTATVVVDKLAFGPAPAGLRVGDTVQWVNQDLFEHTATAPDRSFDVDLKPGKRGRLRLTRPGDLVYTCRLHPGMRGVLHIAR
jgi:plastocyanin